MTKTPMPVPKPLMDDDGVAWCEISCPYYESKWATFDEEEHVCKAEEQRCLPDDGVCLVWAREAAKDKRAMDALRSAGDNVHLVSPGVEDTFCCWFGFAGKVVYDADPADAVLRAAKGESDGNTKDMA